MYSVILDFIEYYSIEITYYELNDLFGQTHPELGFIIYTCYCIQKYKGLFRF